MNCVPERFRREAPAVAAGSGGEVGRGPGAARCGLGRSSRAGARREDACAEVGGEVRCRLVGVQLRRPGDQDAGELPGLVPGEAASERTVAGQAGAAELRPHRADGFLPGVLRDQGRPLAGDQRVTRAAGRRRRPQRLPELAVVCDDRGPVVEQGQVMADAAARCRDARRPEARLEGRQDARSKSQVSRNMLGFGSSPPSDTDTTHTDDLGEASATTVSVSWS